MKGWDFSGDPKELGLSHLVNLREFRGGLTVLLGSENSSRLSLAEVLPEGLEVLSLVDAHKHAPGGWWEREYVAGLVEGLLRERGASSGNLRKVRFVQVEEPFDDGLEEQVWRIWPPKDVVEVIKVVAEEVGVEIETNMGCEGFEEAGELSENGTEHWCYW